MTFVDTAYSLRRDPGGTGQGHNTNYIVGPLQNAGRDPRGVPSTDEVAGGQLVSPASYLLGQSATDRGAVTRREIANGEISSHHGAELVGIAPDLNGGEDHVGHLVGADIGGVGHVDVQVNEDSLGHVSSNRDGDQRSVTGSGAARKGWDGDTSSPERAAPVGVRRLTPLECERLQALPDDWTARGPDSRRYAALGDAVTASVAEWIGRRIVSGATEGDA